MIKNFCDLCGKEAMVLWPEMRVDLPDKTWRGTGKTDDVGIFTPHINARVVFEAYDMPRSVRLHNPDLCAVCMSELLMKMASGLIAKAEEKIYERVEK